MAKCQIGNTTIYLDLFLQHQILKTQDGFYINYKERDYSKSLNKAKSLKGTDFGGYNLLENNCLHYAKSILSETDIDLLTNYYFRNSNSFIPSIFMGISKLCKVVNKVHGFICKITNFLKGIF